MVKLIGKKFASVMELDIAVEHLIGEELPFQAKTIEGGYDFLTESGRLITVLVDETIYGMTVKQVKIN